MKLEAIGWINKAKSFKYIVVNVGIEAVTNSELNINLNKLEN